MFYLQLLCVPFLGNLSIHKLEMKMKMMRSRNSAGRVGYRDKIGNKCVFRIITDLTTFILAYQNERCLCESWNTFKSIFSNELKRQRQELGSAF